MLRDWASLVYLRLLHNDRPRSLGGCGAGRERARDLKASQSKSRSDVEAQDKVVSGVTSGIISTDLMKAEAVLRCGGERN